MRRTGRTGLAILFSLSLLLSACAPAANLAPAAEPRVSAPIASTIQDAEQGVIRELIQRANEEQVRAIAARDPSAMADLATAEHYAELAQVNANLLRQGVTSIALDGLEWGAVSVDGTRATAETHETWSTTYTDGTVEQSRDRNAYILTRAGGTWKIASNEHPGDAPGQAAAPPQQPAAVPPPGGHETSRNWAGYAATGGSFSGVSATWTVPQPNAAGEAGAEATWVGIGGVTSRDLIQAGTSTTVTANGRARYQAWIETLPEPSRPVPLAVRPGDSISVSVVQQGVDQWLFHLVNNTTGQTFQQQEHYASSLSSAEWVEEAPSSGRRLIPLNGFGQVDFDKATAIRDGNTVTLAQVGAYPITMISSARQALAVPTPLGEDGASFSVARTTAAATQPSAGRQRRGVP